MDLPEKRTPGISEDKNVLKGMLSSYFHVISCLILLKGGGVAVKSFWPGLKKKAGRLLWRIASSLLHFIKHE